jgi:hypothetical protein
MCIFLDGKKVKGYYAIYESNKSWFRKKGLTKRMVLHELYHHLVECYKLEMNLTEEERKANFYAKSVLARALILFHG